YNVQGLVLRKVVNYKDALKAFDHVIALGKKNHYNFELALAHLIKSKIDIRMNNIDSCIVNGNEAVRYLKLAIEETTSDTKTSYILFLAESYRVLCDNMIWAGNLISACDYMKKSQDIYIKYAATDRYYIRSQYTQLLLKIVSGEQEVLEKIAIIESKISDSKYDLGQINIVRSIYCLINNVSLPDALNSAKVAYFAYKEIECPLEREEARCLYNIISSRIGADNFLSEYDDNIFINNWVEFYKNFIMNLCSGGKKIA
ncbi:MAG: hypothetical protein K2H85_11535, partial [Allobaculum sp.]|nr:hypothetical protein [Allobaculum sp.]